MALKARLTSVEGLDEAIVALYRKDDDGYVLDVEGVDGWALEDVGGLRSALNTERSSAKEAKKQLEKYKVDGDFLDPVAALDAIERVDELSKIDPNKEADKLAAQKIEAARTALLQEHKAEKEAWESERQKLVAAQVSLRIETALDSAVNDGEVRGIPKALKPYLRPMLGHTVDETGEVRVFVKDTTDPNQPKLNASTGKDMSIKELAMEVKADKELAGMFLPPERKGGGPTPPHNPMNRNPQAEVHGKSRIARALEEQGGSL